MPTVTLPGIRNGGNLNQGNVTFHATEQTCWGWNWIEPVAGTVTFSLHVCATLDDRLSGRTG
jgi:hypothetical protein